MHESFDHGYTTDFSGTHNIDNSSITLSFKTELEIKEYYKLADSLAIYDGWKVPFSSKNYRVYVRNTYGALADSTPIIVKTHSLESGFVIIEVR